MDKINKLILYINDFNIDDDRIYKALSIITEVLLEQQREIEALNKIIRKFTNPRGDWLMKTLLLKIYVYVTIALIALCFYYILKDLYTFLVIKLVLNNL